MPEAVTPTDLAAAVPSLPFWNTFLDICMGVLGVLLLLCLLRAVLGPRIADRIIAVNVMNTLVVILICILALRLGEGYLTDIAMLYTMLSFLAVVLLTKIYVGVWRQRHAAGEAPREGGEDHA